MIEWEAVIGLEIHCRLATDSKLFSGAANRYGAKPNTQACAVDLGLPGVLPVLNERVLTMAIRFGLAVHAEIAETAVFARKHYFYPDLPKGYQISQYASPIVGKGWITIALQDGKNKTIGITRTHLEEDAGKSVHEGFGAHTGIDLNRAGTPLIEIVSEPDMRTAKEAVAYAKKIHALVRYLEISDANMQQGSFRCDANVSVRPKTEKRLGTRTELKNINSFRFTEQAIDYEIKRQIAVLEDGGKIRQETRLYDPKKNQTRAMRCKEEENDYRYFPDPDLLPIKIDADFVAKINAELPELPEQKKQRFIDTYKLSEYDSASLIAQREVADYFEACVRSSGGDAKHSANWIIGDLTVALRDAEKTITESPISADVLGALISKINDNTISNKTAKQVFKALWHKEGTIDQIIDSGGLQQLSDDQLLLQLIDKVIDAHAKQVAQYRSSAPEKQKKMIGFFVGKLMQETKGRANPARINQLLKTALDN